MKKVISIVMNNFKNDSRVLKENMSLKNAGYDVRIIALHDGSSLQEYENIQGLSVHRIILRSKGWSKNLFFQLLKYTEFTYQIIKQYRHNCDIVHCNNLNTLPIGVIMKKIFNTDSKIVYDAHEYETEVNGLKGIRKKLAKILEKKIVRFTDKVITVSDSIANEYVRLYKITKPSLILNAPPYIEFSNKPDIFRNTFNISRESVIFLYQGGLCKGRGIEVILDAFKILDDTAHFLHSKVAIVFMGFGPLESLIQKAAQEYHNIFFHQAVTPHVVLNYTNSADIGISIIEDTCLSYRYSLPNKVFEYTMAELPILTSDLYEMKKLVNDYKIGCVSKENTLEGLISAISEILKMNYQELKNNIRNFKTIYNWEAQEKKLLELYKELS